MRSLVTLLLFSLSLTLHAAPAELDWLELLPPEDLAALEAMPEIEHDGAEAQGFSDGGGYLKQAPGLPEVMYSTRTVTALDNREIRLAGYPVPLESDAQGRFVEFFLVPYPGACIHVPPPPPNQIVLVRYPKGIRIDDIYAPLEVDGRLRVEAASNAAADAAYALGAAKVRVLE